MQNAMLEWRRNWLKLNANKTEVNVVGRGDRVKATFGKNKYRLEQVEIFKYLTVRYFATGVRRIRNQEIRKCLFVPNIQTVTYHMIQNHS